jgi:TRAP-type transport system periplasmic protein
MGEIVPSYFPSLFPHLTALGDMGFLKPEPYTLMFAYADFVMNTENGARDFRNAGVVFGGGQATSTYHLLCRSDVETHAALQGLRVRSPGGGYSRVLEHLGMIPLNIAYSELYTALDRGAVDCVAADASTLNGGPRILPLVKSVILVSMPPYFTTGMQSYNPEFWAGLTPEQRRILLDQTAIAMVRHSLVTEKLAKDALDEARASGVAVVEPGEDITSVFRAWVDDGVGGAAELARTNFGVEDPQAIFDEFATFVDKWAALLEGVGREDEEALVSVLKTNLFDKIDTATYGIY